MRVVSVRMQQRDHDDVRIQLRHRLRHAHGLGVREHHTNGGGRDALVGGDDALRGNERRRMVHGKVVQ